jgi:salicylate hydroxylase
LGVDEPAADRALVEWKRRAGGDACHPMLPFMAQGAVMAIEDAVLLARAIESYRDDLATAIRTYESLRVERANRCVRAADRNREIFHNDRLTDR